MGYIIEMQAAIISVGTELTSGQIINKNAAWISEKLKDLGVLTSCHVTVPDDRALILDALRFCSERSDTLFVTGGLGPTTDDFTRELVAEWAKVPLEFHPPSWEQIKSYLSSRGIEVRETQRQQALFPQGAQVLNNPKGTANGFQMRVRNKDLFVLPGPPNEISAIWEENIAIPLHERAKKLDRMLTYSWDTMGLGESDVAHLTELCLDGIPVEKGYRVHLPYVEVKMSFLESQKTQLLPAVRRLDEALRHITVTRNGESVPELLAQKLKTISKIHVADSLSGSILLNRLLPALRSFTEEHRWHFANRLPASLDNEELTLILRPWDSTSAVAEVHYRGASFKDIFEAPFSISKMKERKALYFAERALIFWLRKLED